MTALLISALVCLVLYVGAKVSWLVTQQRIDQRWNGGTSERGLR